MQELRFKVASRVTTGVGPEAWHSAESGGVPRRLRYLPRLRRWAPETQLQLLLLPFAPLVFLSSCSPLVLPYTGTDVPLFVRPPIARDLDRFAVQIKNRKRYELLRVAEHLSDFFASHLSIGC